MSHLHKSTAPIVPILHTAHEVAEQFCQAQSDILKAEQVYLNTLAVYAVDLYLAEMGVATRLESSDSWNPIFQTAMNAADLEVEGCGKLECRSTLPYDEAVDIPLEVIGDRIGFVAVQLSDSLDEAVLLGFADQVQQGVLTLNALQPIEALPAYLNRLTSAQSNQAALASTSLQLVEVKQETVQLGQWLQKKYEAIWQAFEEVFPSNQVEFAWRSIDEKRLTNQQSQSSSFETSRVKILSFESQLGDDQVALVIEVKATDSTAVKVGIQVRPTGNQVYLPSEIQVKLLDETGSEILQAQAAMSETIRLQISGQQGDRFSIEVISKNRSIIENFAI